MLTSTDLKQFFNEEDSFEQNGKMIYLVPLKEFMKTEEFASFSPVSRKDTNETTAKLKLQNVSF